MADTGVNTPDPHAFRESPGVMIARLQAAGIFLSLDGGDIRYRAEGHGKAELVRALAGRRAEILLYLKARQAARFSPAVLEKPPLIPSLTQELWWQWIDKDISLTLTLMEMVKDADAGSVADVISGLVREHETLRSRFSQDFRGLTVAVNDADGFAVEHEALANPDAARLKACMDEFTGRPLTMQADWLARARVISLSPDRHVAVIVINHLVADGTSIDILRSQLRHALKRVKADRPMRPGLPYSSFAHWQKAGLAHGSEALGQYWSHWANGRPELHSPSGKPMRWQPGRKVRRTFVIPGFAQAAVADIARRNGTFAFHVYLTLLAVSVARWSGSWNFPIRSICDARVLPQFYATIGLMTGADTLAISLAPESSFAESLRAVAAEYQVASKLRLPNIYAFPPYAAANTDYDQRENVGVVLNYRKTSGHSGALADGERAGTWPPPEGPPRRDVWAHHVSPVCLELTQVGSGATAAFLLHEDVIPAAEQNGLITIFFEVFAQLLQADRIASAVDG